MYEALKNGYRTKANGERVWLTKEIAKQYVAALKAARVKYGRLAYDSANGPYVNGVSNFAGKDPVYDAMS